VEERLRKRALTRIIRYVLTFAFFHRRKLYA
jgi:hypothetical protein